MAQKGAADAAETGEGSAPVGKGRPTPSRKQAEAANARPLVGSKDKAVIKEQRRAQNEARERARIGMLQGEERYLMPRDRGPQRRFVRDYVDARWSIGEFLIPMMLVVLVMTFIPGTLQMISLYVVWGFVGLAVIDAIFLGQRLQGKLAAKFGSDKVEKGFRWYAAMRAMQFRPMRAPKPQGKRGDFPS